MLQTKGPIWGAAGGEEQKLLLPEERGTGGHLLYSGKGPFGSPIRCPLTVGVRALSWLHGGGPEGYEDLGLTQGDASRKKDTWS